MKIFKRIVGWSILALVLQSCIFFICDKYYQRTLLNTKVNEEIVKNHKEVDLHLSIKIPTTASKIQSSFDGKYISYYDNSKLIVINSYTGKSNIVGDIDNSQIIYSKWKPDIDSMSICEKKSNKKITINTFTYNADTNKVQTPTDSNNKDVKFTVANENDTISDIQMSPKMYISYIKVMRNSLTSDVFYNDVNGETSRIFNSKHIGRIRTFDHNPNLIYEDTSTNSIKVSNMDWSLDNIQACLLNTANNDNIYIGALKNGKVYKIMYGSTDKSVKKWTSIVLNSPVDKKHISVTKSGAIFIDSNLEGYVTNQISKKKTSYDGTILEITDTKIISIDNGIIKKVNLP
ncbi:hypothetical protein KTC96_18850 [Clostridium estertheticum]|uniref:hypothetical protein n=1 Tax=Clostridium estertheticum TaxID=238834 RepID=UPI001C7D9590|nr:hypothetical protein [Clostridium estertheticum]MBX4258564.1 hypothetical protein [Clostridium estertheticum]WLC69958.1 hypothetical protein KTC96_18850 [Clostridium estertheticum]